MGFNQWLKNFLNEDPLQPQLPFTTAEEQNRYSLTALKQIRHTFKRKKEMMAGVLLRCGKTVSLMCAS